MAKITMTLCDVAPCTLIAEREFKVNGETIYVCGENCFVKFWSREFRNWKNERYEMEAQLNVDQDEIKRVILKSSRENGADLQVLKPSRNLDSARNMVRVER